MTSEGSVDGGSFQGPLYEFRGFRLDVAGRSLTGPDGERVALQAKAFDLLVELVEHSGQPMEKEALLEKVWQGRIVEENSLSRAGSTLRKVLGDDAREPKFIATIPGRGYQFIAPVEVRDASSSASIDVEGRSVGPVRVTRGVAVTLTAAALGLLAVLLIWAWRRVPEESANDELRGLRVVTDFPGSHTSPAVSPDGSMLAFSSDASGTFQIWVMTLAERAPRQITRLPSPASHPTWSPDNDRILFEVAGQGIWSVDPLGAAAPRRLTDSGRSPAFAPSNEFFVFEQGDEIWLASPDGGSPRRVEGVPHRRFINVRADPVVSPDSQHIVFFLSERAIAGDYWRVPVAGGDAVRLTFDTVSGGGASWTPEGRHIVFASSRSGSQPTNLWQLPLAGGDPIALTSGVGENAEPALSPDGRTVYFVNRRIEWQLVLTDPSSAKHEVLLAKREMIVLPVVSPDGKQILFFAPRPGGSHVFRIAIDGTDLFQVTSDDQAVATAPTWSSDGEATYYYEDRSRSLRRVRADGTHDQEFIPDFHWKTGQVYLAPTPHRPALTYVDLGGELAARTVIRDLKGSRAVRIPGPAIMTPNWNADGTRLLGARRGEIVICSALDLSCEAVMHGGTAVRGAEPRWSRDESKIFFRRPKADPRFHTLWSLDLATGRQIELFELGPIEPNSVGFGVTADDRIVWARQGEGEGEIWAGERL